MKITSEILTEMGFRIDSILHIEDSQYTIDWPDVHGRFLVRCRKNKWEISVDAGKKYTAVNDVRMLIYWLCQFMINNGKKIAEKNIKRQILKYLGFTEEL